VKREKTKIYDSQKKKKIENGVIIITITIIIIIIFCQWIYEHIFHGYNNSGFYEQVCI
jgi:hypothetical protein